MIGEGFVGPASIKVRADIPIQSTQVATVSHGEKLDILQKRRTFLRVRTAKGIEGWVDERSLLGPADMAQLKQMADTAAKMPSQGGATPRFGDMKVYMLPSTGSPSFLMVKDKERVEVVASLPVVRANQTPRTPLVKTEPKKPLPQKKKKNKSQSKLDLPPPKLPEPPPGWDYKGPEENQPPEPSDAPAPQMDYWSLIRTADGQAGWALTRRLLMAIPDEVAQYAEGRRIVSYFSLGKTADKDNNQHDIWLWTTIRDGVQPYDFDGFRVFVWNTKRNHYGTAHIEKNLHGFQPVLVESETVQAAKGRVGVGESHPGFSVCMENKDGERVRREFALIGQTIRTAGERPCEAAMTLDGLMHKPAENALTTVTGPAAAESFGHKWSRRWHSLTKGLFGK